MSSHDDKQAATARDVMRDNLYDLPAWVWSCLRTEWLTPDERVAAERLRGLFGSFGVELDALGAEHDPDGVAAYKDGVQVASELRQREHPKGMYEALFRLCQRIAQTHPAAG